MRWASLGAEVCYHQISCVLLLKLQHVTLLMFFNINNVVFGAIRGWVDYSMDGLFYLSLLVVFDWRMEGFMD